MTSGLGWALNPMTAVLINERRDKFNRETQESHVKPETEVVVMCL